MTKKTLIEADLGENGGGVVSFDAPEDVEAFANDEESALGWIDASLEIVAREFHCRTRH